MNTEQKLKTSLAAAKMLYKHKNSRGKITLVRVEGGKVTLSSRETPFSLSNPADCLAVVKMLGLDYGIGFQFHKGGNVWFIHYDVNDKRFVLLLNADLTYSTYEEAVSAAVMEVSND